MAGRGSHERKPGGRCPVPGRGGFSNNEGLQRLIGEGETIGAGPTRKFLISKGGQSAPPLGEALWQDSALPIR